MITIDEYKENFTPIYKTLATHYQGLFYNGSKSDMAQHLLLWIKSLFNAQIDINKIKEFTNYILNESTTYNQYPPNPSQFIDSFKEWETSQTLNDKDTDLLEEINNVYKLFSLRYEQLWARNEIGTVESHKSFWISEILKEKPKKESILKAYDRIRKINNFKIYPPNIDQFIEILKIENTDSSLPTPEEAYSIAISDRNSKNLPLLIQYARRKFGYLKLIDQSRYRNIKTDFENFYRNALNDFYNGRLNLEKMNLGEHQNQVSPLASSSKISDALDDILSDY